MDIWILAFLGEHLRTHLIDHATYGQCPGIHSKPKRVLLLVDKTLLPGCLKVWVGGLLEWDTGNYALFNMRLKTNKLRISNYPCVCIFSIN